MNILLFKFPTKMDSKREIFSKINIDLFQSALKKNILED